MNNYWLERKEPKFDCKQLSNLEIITCLAEDEITDQVSDETDNPDSPPREN